MWKTWSETPEPPDFPGESPAREDEAAGSNAGREREQRARAYNRTHRYLRLADFALGWAWLLALLFAGWSIALRDAAGQVTSVYWLALPCYLLLVTGIGKLIGLPLDFYSGYVIEHRYGLSTETPRKWAKDQLKGFLLGTVLALAAAELVYLLIRTLPEWWWLAAWAAFLVLVVALANLAPVLLFPLFFKFRPLEDEELKRRLLQLSERAGTRVRGVYEWKLSEKSRKANAALAGWGNTRRIIVADTLLDRYTHDEIEAIFAHELAHHVYNHIPKGLALQAIASLAGFWLAAQALQRFTPRFGFRGLDDFANLPLLLVVSGVLSLVLLPVVNAVSRYFERQADDYALRSIPSTGPFITSMEKLAEQNLAERRPNPVIEFLFHSHPSIARRVARARARA